MNALLLVGTSVVATKPAKLDNSKQEVQFPKANPNNISSIKSNRQSSLRCYCSNTQTNDNSSSKGFALLSFDNPWEKGTTWSTMAMYMLCLHIPLGIGGLSVVAYVLNRRVLDPETEALSLLVIQVLELTGTYILLKNTTKSEYKLSLLGDDNSRKKRNWLLASALGLGFLVLIVFLSSLLLDELVGSKAVNNPELKEILLSSDVAKDVCVLVYCFITPLLEETVYRSFLLKSLASTMDWKNAVLISSAVFSTAHFSGENFLQLFIIGCVLGCCYCWTGNLRSSIAVHSLYNAITLIITATS